MNKVTHKATEIFLPGNTIDWLLMLNCPTLVMSVPQKSLKKRLAIGVWGRMSLLSLMADMSSNTKPHCVAFQKTTQATVATSTYGNAGNVVISWRFDAPIVFSWFGSVSYFLLLLVFILFSVNEPKIYAALFPPHIHTETLCRTRSERSVRAKKNLD